MKVLVLMSTYNGDRFLRTQIDSILAQEEVEVSLLVRDDGSTDGTLSILEDYQRQRKLSFSKGENIGIAQSFMRLLCQAPAAPYYAFADQDDFWLPEKLRVAIEKLQATEINHRDTKINQQVTEIKRQVMGEKLRVTGKKTTSYGEKSASGKLYFSQTQLADAQLQPLKTPVLHPHLTLGEALIHKFASGCTMVFNHELRILAETPPTHHPIPMHDMWFYLVAMASGAAVCFDPIPHLLYRQHESNAVGLNHNFLHTWKERAMRFLSHGHKRSLLAASVAEVLTDKMPKENEQIIQRFIEGRKSASIRWEILKDKRYRCGSPITQLLFWANLLTNKY